MSCNAWMIGQFQWTYYEVYLHKSVPDLNGGDIRLLSARDSDDGGSGIASASSAREIQLRFGYLDLVLLFIWWTYLYAFAVLPWLYASPSRRTIQLQLQPAGQYSELVIVAGWGALWLGSARAWRLCMPTSSALLPPTCSPRLRSMWLSPTAVLPPAACTDLPSFPFPVVRLGRSHCLSISGQVGCSFWKCH